MCRRYTILFVFFLLFINAVIGQDITPPDTPVLDTVSVADPLTGSVYISWFPSDSADVVSYVIYRSVNTIWQQIAVVPAPATFYTDNSAAANFHPELYRIAALDEANNISPMTAQGQHHNTMYVFPYQDSVNCQMAIRLSWNKYINWVEGVKKYHIYVSMNYGPWNWLASVDGNTSIYFHETINDNTSYCYYIRAESNTGRSSTSNQTCFFTNLPDPPSFVNVDYATVSGDQKIDLSFTVDSTADYKNYRIYRAHGIDGAFTAIKYYQNYLYSKILYSDLVDSKQKWFYKLTAVDQCGNDILESNLARNITISASSNDDLTELVTWDSYVNWLGGIESYNLYRIVDDFPPVLVSTITNLDTVFLDDVSEYAMNRTGASGKFCYYIEAVEGDGNPYGIKGTSKSTIACATQFERVFVPNTFTPNGDNLNAEFLPIVSFVKPDKYSLMVFDRWGQKIFETTDRLKGWDGKKNGNKVPGGTYIYKFTYMTTNDQLKEKAGNIYLFYP
jgi:gliding motility-associated-like protein